MNFKNKFKEIAEKITNEAAVDSETRNTRLKICESCEFLFKPTSTCKKCGCYMPAKTWIRFEECPIKKWNKEPVKENSNEGNGQG